MEKQENENGKENRQEIRIVSGDPKDLDISPVYEHINIEKPTQEKKKHIVVPEEKNKRG